MGTEPPAGAQGESRADRENSWGARRGLSILVSVSAFLLPVLVAVAAAALFVHLVSKPRSGPELWLWWALAIVSPWVVYVVADRVARQSTAAAEAMLQDRRPQSPLRTVRSQRRQRHS